MESLSTKKPPGAVVRYDGRPVPPRIASTLYLLGPCYHPQMSGAKLALLVAVFFLTSVISVVIGSTSLITVPVVISLGIEAHVAVATNMLAFMSVGGSLPFMGRGAERTTIVLQMKVRA
jgi:hypothetical protein